MAMGQQKDRQGDLVVNWFEMPRSPAHLFYDCLQSVLIEGGFDALAEASRWPDYAARMSALLVSPGCYFRMHVVGYFKGIDSERGMEWHCSDSLSLRAFLRPWSRVRVPDHFWLPRSRTRLPHEVHAAVFHRVLVLIAEAARRAVTNNRGRPKSGVAREALKFPAEFVERSVAHNLDPDYVQSSGSDHRIPGIAGILARVGHGGPSAVRGLEARDPRRPATPGSHGTGLRIVRNQDLDCGGILRTWLRQRGNAHKRYRFHASGHNLSILMRQLIGADNQRELEAGGYGSISMLFPSTGAMLVAWGPRKTVRRFSPPHVSSGSESRKTPLNQRNQRAVRTCQC